MSNMKFNTLAIMLYVLYIRETSFPNPKRQDYVNTFHDVTYYNCENERFFYFDGTMPEHGLVWLRPPKPKPLMGGRTSGKTSQRPGHQRLCFCPQSREAALLQPTRGGHLVALWAGQASRYWAKVARLASSGANTGAWSALTCVCCCASGSRWTTSSRSLARAGTACEATWTRLCWGLSSRGQKMPDVTCVCVVPLPSMTSPWGEYNQPSISCPENITRCIIKILGNLIE